MRLSFVVACGLLLLPWSARAVGGQPFRSGAGLGGEARKAPVESATAPDRDHEFDGGSRIAVGDLSSQQIDDLVVLGRVWGFLKYHHPAVTSGQRQWDYELFRIVPAILRARSRSETNTVLLRWVDGLGPIQGCNPCARLDSQTLELSPDLGWIEHRSALGKRLSMRLREVYAARRVGQQFYVSLVPGVLNPLFEHEPAFEKVVFPDPGFQLLALYRFWNIMQYWSPNREVAGENWPEVLREFVPRVMLAKDKDAYQVAMLALVAKAHDTHTNLWSSLDVRPPRGGCRLPVNVRFVEGRAVVVSYASTKTGAASGLAVGDVLEQIDGTAVDTLIKTWAPLYADSNEAARLRDMARSLTSGRCGGSDVRVRRAAASVEVHPQRLPSSAMDAVEWNHDLPGPTFRLLSEDVAYLKLSSVKIADVGLDVAMAKGTKGLIVDTRNYPSEFVVFALGSVLMNQRSPFALFTNADLSNPGAFHWGHVEALEPAEPHYGGKVVVLVDETSVSQAEYTAMALRSGPRTIVVGSMTAGADGNVSQIPLPGYLMTSISGIGVFYPDKRPTQRVGVAIDVEVRPTLAGVRAGRDEVLEVGVRQIVGTSVSAAEVERMSRP